MSRDLIIKVIGDDTKLKPTVETMKEMGIIDEKNAKQFQKNHKKLQAEQTKTLGILEKARIKEKQIIDARERSTNPKAITRYNTLLDKQRTKIRQISGETSKQVKQMNLLQNSIASIGAVLVASFSVQALVQFGKELASLSIQLEADAKKNAVVFGDSLGFVTEQAKENANAIGLTSNEYIRASASTQDLLVPLGFLRSEAAKMSTDLTDLSGALSVWSGGTRTATEVSEILTKTILGETEQIKTLGIKIDQTSPAFNRRIKEMMATNDVSLEQAKALEILNQITTKSIDAQTSFAEGQKTMAQQQAEVNAEMRETKEIIANQVAPAYLALLKSFQGATDVNKALFNDIGIMFEFMTDAGEIWLKNVESNIGLTEKVSDVTDDYAQNLKAVRSQLSEIGVVFNRSGGVNEGLVNSVETLGGLGEKLTGLRAKLQVTDTASAKFRELGVEIKNVEKRIKFLVGTDKKAASSEETLLGKLTREAAELKRELMGQALAGNLSKDTLDNYLITIEVLEKAQRDLNASIDKERESREGLLKFVKAEQLPLMEEFDEDLILFWDKKEQAYTLITQEEANKREEIYRQESATLKQLGNQAVQSLQQTFRLYTQFRLSQIEKLQESGRLSDEEADVQKKKVLTQQAEREKDFKIFSIITSTAQAVTQAFTLPWPLSLVIAALMGGLGAAQLSIVEQTPVPQFARGTKGKKDSGMARVGEEGEELVYLPQNTKVLPAQETKKYGDIIDAMYDNKLDDFILKNYMPQLIPKAVPQGVKDDNFIGKMIQGFGEKDFNSDAIVDTLRQLDKKDAKRMDVLVSAIGVVVNKRANLMR